MLTLYSAADLLTAPGCPVCGYAAEASDRYLRWFALEGHADPAMITTLCASLGTCAAHARALASQPGAAVRLTAVYRYIVTAAGDRLAGQKARQAACPACEHDDSAAGRALDTLLEDLGDPAVLGRLRELGGLCLPHLTAAAARSRDAAALAELAELAERGIAARGARCDWLAGADPDAENRAALRQAMPAARLPGQAGCSPCLAGAQAERHALARLPGLAAGGQDPALALCAGHLADAASEAGAGGIRPLLGWQLQCLVSGLPRRRPRRLAMTRRPREAGCVICQSCRAAEQRSLGDRPAVPRPAVDGAALCVRHHLVLRAADPGTARLLAGGAVRQAGQLAAELAAAFDRFAQARGTGTAAPPSTAWQRAAAFLDGRVFGGLRQPPQ